MSIVLWFTYVVSMGFPLYGGAVINSILKTQGLLTTSLLGFATGMSPLIQGIMAPVTAWMLGKRSYRFAYLVGFSFLLAGFLLLAVFPFSPFLFLLAYGLFMGVGMGIGGNYLVQTTINGWFDKKKSLALAISLSGGGMAGFVLPPLMQTLLGDGNWRRGWWISAAVVGVVLVVCFFFIKESPEVVGQTVSDEGGRKKGEDLLVHYLRPSRTHDYLLKEAIREPLYYGVLLNSFTRYFSYYGVISHLLIHTVYRGMDAGTGSFVLSALSLGNLSGRFIAGFVGERHLSPKNSLLLSGTTMLLATGLLAAPSGNFGLGLGAVLTGFSLGYGSLMQAVAVSRFFGNKDFAKIYGSMTPIFNFGGALGPMLAGLFASSYGNYDLAFWIFTLLNLFGILLLFFTKPKEA